MNDKTSFEQMIDAAPPGLIMEGNVQIVKAIHQGQQRIVLIGTIGDNEFRKELSPGLLKALTGHGPAGRVLGRLFGGAPPIEAPEP